MELIDNKSKLLGDDLSKEIKSGTTLKIVASYFSVYAFEALKDELSKIEELQNFIYLDNGDKQLTYTPIKGVTSVDLGYEKNNTKSFQDYIQFLYKIEASAPILFSELYFFNI